VFVRFRALCRSVALARRRANVLDALKLMLSPEPGRSDEDTLDVPLAS